MLINCFKQVLIKEEEMKRVFSAYIIFAFLLTSFAGCGKLKSSPVSGLNQSEAPTPPKVNSQPDTSAPPEVNSQPEASSEIGAKDLTKKESWTEWTCRQWKDNKWKWISGVVVVVVGTSGVCYYRRSVSVASRLVSDEHLLEQDPIYHCILQYRRLLEERRLLLLEKPPSVDALRVLNDKISDLQRELRCFVAML
jgi:hypothetical protein